jgi:hypothetical protein
MSDNLVTLLNDLPSSSLTTRLLGLLDTLVPGEWENVRTLEEMVRRVTGETDEALIQQVGERAVMLYNDPALGYSRAVRVYQLVDDTGTLSGVLSLASKASEDFDFLSFLDKVTPKSETTQAIDAAVKLVAELSAFCLTNGLPGDSVGDFVRALAAYGKEEKMRLVAFLAFDCVLPLGPEFLNTILGYVENLADSLFGENSRFAKIASFLPGDAIGDKKKLLAETMQSSGSMLQGFVAQHAITQDSILEKARAFTMAHEGKLDYLAAAIDLTTNVFEHTGIQTVARRIVTRAYAEI